MSGETEDPQELRSAERMKFFTDAVVAIAMTLLILPLLESVSALAEHAEGNATTRDFLGEHGDQLFTFVLSFGIIAGFWVSHERLFDNVGHWTGRLMVLNFAWMLTIVFLPIATALVGTLETDRGQIGLYVGTMLASSLLLIAMTLEIRFHPIVRERDLPPRDGGLAAQLAQATLYALAILASLVIVPSYYWLFLLFLSGPVQRMYAHLIAHLIARRAARTARPA